MIMEAETECMPSLVWIGWWSRFEQEEGSQAVSRTRAELVIGNGQKAI